MNDITPVSGALQIATNAITRSRNNLAKDASVVANSTDVEARDTVNALVDSRQQVIYTRAAARVISATDEMTQALLDIHA